MQTSHKTIHSHWNASPEAVTLIDAHHHLWDLRLDKHPWLCGAEDKPFFMGDYGPLKKNYLPADYRRDAAGHNVLTTVHCEAEWDRANPLAQRDPRAARLSRRHRRACLVRHGQC